MTSHGLRVKVDPDLIVRLRLAGRGASVSLSKTTTTFWASSSFGKGEGRDRVNKRLVGEEDRPPHPSRCQM